MASRSPALSLFALALACACGAPAPSERFLFGAATAAYQVEGGIESADWSDWERLGHIQRGDRTANGPRMVAHWEADLDEAAAMGHNAYRLSLEWARLEPRRGEYDGESLLFYRRLVAGCRARGLEPMVTLSHFTLPAWLHDVTSDAGTKLGWAGGGARPGDGEVVEAFAGFASAMGREFGDEVDLWVPLNEPMVQITATYLNPTQRKDEHFPRPPQLGPLDLRTGMHAMTNFAYAHAKAYDALKAADVVDADGDGVACSVGIAQHMRHMVPSADQDDYRVAAERADYAFNFLFVDALVRGDLDVTLDGKFDAAGEGRGIPELAGRLDFVGVNYYSRSEVLPVTLTAPQPYDASKTFSLRALSGETTSFGGPTSDLGWDLYPDGFREVMVRTAQRYGLPIYVTENGMADGDDEQRPAFIVHHLRALQDARRQGADIRGYLHWSLLDNFEWVRGFEPRFGLLRVDYGDPARKRTRTGAADVYSEIIRRGAVDDAMLEAYPLR